MTFMTNHLCSFMGERGEANLEERADRASKWKYFWCFVLFFFSSWTKKQMFLYGRNIKTLGVGSAAKHTSSAKKKNTCMQM